MNTKRRELRDREGAGKTGAADRGAGIAPAPFRINEAALQSALQRLETNFAQLEQTQSQLHAIIDASPDAMLFLTPDGRPTRVNVRFTDFFGIEDIIVLSQLPDQLLCLLKGVFLTKQAEDDWLGWSITDQEHVFRTKEVRVAAGDRVLDLSSRPVHNVDRSYLGRLYIWHDVTQERELEQMRSRFVSMVSHELRTPLTCIKGYVEVVLTDDTFGGLTESQREFLEISRSEVRRLERIMNDLLDLSHLESGKLALHLEALDINQLIAALLPSFRPVWEKKRQTFTLRLPGAASMVLGDADRVTQILTNLLSNAHKYTPEEGRIDLAVEEVGSMVSIAVTDTGIGLSSEEQAQLFTSFYRAHNDATKEIDGTGLGLTITRLLVEMHKGTIQVTSEPGHGSTFRFTLPLA